MKGKNDIIAVFQVFAHVFHLACINVRHGKLTVLGRLMMALRSAVGCHTSRTALHTSSAYSGSVPVKLSGELLKDYFSVIIFHIFLYHAGTIDRDLLYFLAVCMEYNLTL